MPLGIIEQIAENPLNPAAGFPVPTYSFPFQIICASNTFHVHFRYLLCRICSKGVVYLRRVMLCCAAIDREFEWSLEYARQIPWPVVHNLLCRQC